jgi:hypothetical protein
MPPSGTTRGVTPTTIANLQQRARTVSTFTPRSTRAGVGAKVTRHSRAPDRARPGDETAAFAAEAAGATGAALPRQRLEGVGRGRDRRRLRGRAARVDDAIQHSSRRRPGPRGSAPSASRALADGPQAASM